MKKIVLLFIAASFSIAAIGQITITDKDVLKFGKKVIDDKKKKKEKENDQPTTQPTTTPVPEPATQPTTAPTTNNNPVSSPVVEAPKQEPPKEVPKIPGEDFRKVTIKWKDVSFLEFSNTFVTHEFTEDWAAGIVGGADFDGDKDCDLLTEKYQENSFNYMQNNGGKFTTTKIPIPKGYYYPDHIWPIDIDKDGDLDFFGIPKIEGYYNGEVQLYKNLGKGLKWEMIMVAEKDAFIERIADFKLVDIENDGDMDIVIAEKGVLLIENEGAGVFKAPRYIFKNWVSNYPGDTAVEVAYTVCVADFDGDKDNDLVVEGSWQKMIYVEKQGASWANKGKEIFDMEHEIYIPEAMEAVDIDKDGDLDISAMVPKAQGVMRFMNSDGKGNFTYERYTHAQNSTQIRSADMNNDGTPDIIAGFMNNQEGVQLLTVTGNTGVTTWIGKGIENPWLFEILDINGDGHLDILISGRDGALDSHTAWMENKIR